MQNYIVRYTQMKQRYIEIKANSLAEAERIAKVQKPMRDSFEQIECSDITVDVSESPFYPVVSV